MTKKQQETLDILKQLVEKQKASIAEKDEKISKLITTDVEEEIEELHADLNNLQEELDNVKRLKCNNQIDCGIGKINYLQPSNLQLQMLMESLEEAIKKQGSLFMLEALKILSE